MCSIFKIPVSPYIMFGTLSSVANVLPPAGFFSLYDCPSLHQLSPTELRFLAEYACIFCFHFSRERSSSPLGFSSILRRKPIKQEADT